MKRKCYAANVLSGKMRAIVRTAHKRLAKPKSAAESLSSPLTRNTEIPMPKAPKSTAKPATKVKAVKAKPAAKAKAAPKAKAKTEPKARKCGACGKYNTGHNARSCKG